MIRQRTIKEPVTLEGVGLQTGNRVTLKLNSAPADSGINFIRTDLPDKPSINIRSMALKNPISWFERRTTIGIGPLQVQTTEHILAALSGLSIDNMMVELDNVELPGMDGSALEFVEAIKKAGIIEQDSPKKFLKIKDPVWYAGADNIIAIFPDEDFRVSYTLSYENPVLGDQFFSMKIDRESFERELAPARTFCLEEEARELLKRGLGKGANYENTLVIGKNGPIDTTMRFSNEPVRHKVLDLIGDLYILGIPVKGHVVAVKSGHKLNMELVKRLKQPEGE